MLRKLRQRPLLVETGEVLVDAARYLAVMALVVLFLVQLVKV